MGHSADQLRRWHDAIRDALGDARWWPADSPFEVAVGAILAQNVSWANVAKAIDALKQDGLLEPHALHDLATRDPEALAVRIRPAGHFRVKAQRLRNLLEFLHETCQLDLPRLAEWDLAELREKLLAVRGVGPETADSILCYALALPSFVVDAYTARIAARHGLVPEESSYDELREYFMDRLPQDVVVYNDFHAQLVRVGAAWCKKAAPRCQDGCPLAPFLP